MVVFKFGGTSVQDAEAMKQVLEIITPHRQTGLILVSSAMAGVTNTLVELIQAVKTEDRDNAERLLNALEERHTRVLDELTSNAHEIASKAVKVVLRDMRTLVKGSFLLGECSPRVSDALLGSGELLSTALLHGLALQAGLSSQLMDARKLLVTDDRFGEAGVLWPETQAKVSAVLTPEPGKVYILQGFIGATVHGVATTLGRGGSDYSASLFGAAVQAQRIEIWTDVNGIMTTDPRKVPTARSIPVMTYAEAAELAFFGAKVVHPATIQPAVERDIPVLVKNTKNPTHPGTIVQGEAPLSGVRAIAGRQGVTLITVTSSRMLMAYGFLKKLFTIFDAFETSVDLIATSEVSVSMTINSCKDLAGLRQALESLGTVRIQPDMAILSLVGKDLWKDGKFLVEAFAALQGIPVHLVSMGASEINVSLVLKASELNEGVKRTHRAFFAQS